MKKIIIITLIAGACIFFLQDFFFSQQDRPSNVEAKLSHDGSVIAVSQYKNSGTTLRIGRLEKQSYQLVKLEVPKWTRSFNFGNKNNEILITYASDDEESKRTVILAGISTDKISKPFVEYARSDIKLDFPTQLENGDILVLSGVFKTSSGRVPTKIWQIISPGKPPVTISEPWDSMGSHPILYKDGFYSVEAVYPPGTSLPKVHRWSLPNGAKPDISQFIDLHTGRLNCTKEGDFCVKTRIFSAGHQYRNELVAIANGRECPVDVGSEWIDRVNVAQNARVVALVIAKNSLAQRRVKVMQFSPNSCKLINAYQLEN